LVELVQDHFDGVLEKPHHYYSAFLNQGFPVLQSSKDHFLDLHSSEDTVRSMNLGDRSPR